MDEIAVLLAPAIIVSIALQQLIELLDPALDALIRQHKKWILSAVALVLALVLTLALNLRLLAPLGHAQVPGLDVALTALFLIGGSKGFNDLLKWVSYKKVQARSALAAEGEQLA
jgi:hypothetical protein